MLFARLVLLLTGLLFAGYGAFCLYNPDYLAGILVPGVEPSAALQSELRAMYGGLQLAFGLALLGFLPKARLRWGLWVMFFIFLGLAAARTAGVVLDGGLADGYVQTALVYEWLTFVIVVISLRFLPRTTTHF